MYRIILLTLIPYVAVAAVNVNSSSAPRPVVSRVNAAKPGQNPPQQIYTPRPAYIENGRPVYPRLEKGSRPCAQNEQYSAKTRSCMPK